MKKSVRLTESDFRKVVKKIIQINENEETIPTENNSWQDYVKNFNVGDNFHSYEYIREAAGEVLYEFTIGLKKFLEENGITVLDNSSEPFPESTVSFSYYEDLDNNERDSEKSLQLNWKNDEENNILKNIADYYRQHKDNVSPHGLNQGRLSTGMFFKAKDEVKTPSKINEFSSKKNIVKLTESDIARIVKRVMNEQESKPNMFNDCKSGNCSGLFNYVMKLKGWDKKYPQMNSNGVIYLQGKNSNGKRISILFPKQNSRNMDIMINGKQKSFPLFDILQSAIENQNNNELNDLLD